MNFKINGMILVVLLFTTVSSTIAVNFDDSSETGIILIGDTGKDNDGQLNVSNSIQNFCATEKCDLGLMAGDNVYPAGLTSPTDKIMERLFDFYYNPLNIPFLIALGNHDYGKFSNDWKRGAWQLKHAEKNPAFQIPNYYYIHETKDAVIAVIDTSRLMWRKDTFAQRDMLAEAYGRAKSQNKWYFVMGHHPYLSNGKHGNAGNYERLRTPYFISGTNVQKFIERHVCDKAHFYFAGHEHSLQVIDGNVKGCNTQLIVSGTGASATKLFKRNRVDFESLELGYFHLGLTADTLRVRAIGQNSKVMFEKNYIRTK